MYTTAKMLSRKQYTGYCDDSLAAIINSCMFDL